MTTQKPYLLRDAATAVNIRQAEDVRNWTRTPATVGEHLSRGAYSRPRHIDYLAEKIAEIAERQVFLDINMPPQHGKSELVSHWTPVWFLKKFPWKKIGLASYEYQYASEWGGKAKDTISDNIDELGLELKRDTKAKGRWNLRGYGGGMFVAGIGGPFTGRGFDCITGKTRISTEYGEIPIEALYNGTPSGKILSYDIERGCLEYKKAQAFRRRKVKGLYRITTASGRMVEATGNHRFWTDRGYIPTNLLSAGDNFLCLVPEGIHKTGVRGIQSDIQAGSQGILLLSEMLESSSCNQERSPMRKMWSPYAWDTYETILQSGMPEETAMVTSMPNVQEVFLSQRFETTILLQGMCERCPFPENEGQREFSLQERSIIRKMLRINETLYPSEGQELCSMWVKEEVIRTPYKQCTNGQSTRKSGCALFDVPYNSSSLCRDTISTVERICGSEDYVYDIQVEKNHNFFAEGILAHNCIIIDDPIKNDQEALSPVYRRRIWNWYRTVARTRLAPGGSIILIMTRWHEQDLAGALLGNPPEEEGEEILEEDVEPDAWEEINLMALAEEGDPLGRRLGQALWPERYDETALKKSRMAAGPFWWSAQYRGKPQPEGGGIIKTYWFKSYEDDELPKNYSRIIQIWDTAYKEKQKHDRSACLTLGQAARPRRYYLLDLYVARIPFPDLNRAAEAQYDKWNPDRVLIEDKASGISLIQQLRRDTHVPIRAIPAVDDKVTRAHTITGILEAGLVSVPRHASWLADFLKEIADFPNGAHDDIVDVLVHGLRYLKPRLKQGRLGIEHEEKRSRWRE